MIFHREWAMHSPETFTIKPIRHLLGRWIPPCRLVVDPAARDSFWGTHTNDLNPNTRARWHLHAVKFLALMQQAGLWFDAALLDLPYSPRQAQECYQKIGSLLTQQDVQSLWRMVKDGIDSVLKPGGLVVCCGWNSIGMGTTRGYQPIEMLSVCHGGDHNDTIVIVERKRC
jgi:hypothetical protein